MARRMALTMDLVVTVPPWSEEESVGPMPAGSRLATDGDHENIVAELLAGAPEGDVWVFAYGSLIWNPGFDYAERIVATARGWHRAFRLGWDLWFRGSPARPGLMLVLDRGGSCNGVAFRLPEGKVAESLAAMSRREVHILPHPFPPRWITVVSQRGTLRAVTFAMDRSTDQYVRGQSLEDIADVLSTAAGRTGSMADYLFQTVRRLEEFGLRDRRLWQLQELVAARLEAAIR